MSTRARTQEQVGDLAFRVFEALKAQKFTVAELTNFGEVLYAGEDIMKVGASARIKLFKAAQSLDQHFPLPPPAPVPAPAAPIIAPVPQQPQIPAPAQPQAAAPVPNGAAHHHEVAPAAPVPTPEEPPRG